jgi:hypothetical protein
MYVAEKVELALPTRGDSRERPLPSGRTNGKGYWICGMSGRLMKLTRGSLPEPIDELIHFDRETFTRSGCLLQPSRLKPRTDGLDKFSLALKRNTVARGQVRYGKVVAGAAHGFSEAVAIDVADGVPVTVDEQHGLA